MAVALSRRQRGRDRLYPRQGPRHAVRVLAGRLHPDMQILSHRNAEAGSQPDSRRDHRPGDARDGRTRRLAGRKARPAADQHRPDGHGRAAIQLRQCRQGDADHHERRGCRPVEAPHNPVYLRRRSGDCALRGRAWGQPCDLAPCRPRRAARRAGANQPQIPARRADRGMPQLSRPFERPPDHLGICDARRRQ